MGNGIMAFLNHSSFLCPGDLMIMGGILYFLIVQQSPIFSQKYFEYV
jgi:hypothetical protein